MARRAFRDGDLRNQSPPPPDPPGSSSSSPHSSSAGRGVACKNEMLGLCPHSTQRLAPLVPDAANLKTLAPASVCDSRWITAFSSSSLADKLQGETCKKFGFVVTRRRRTLSLDDDHVLKRGPFSPSATLSAPHDFATASAAAAMGKTLVRSQDDSCIPFLSTECTASSQLRRDLLHHHLHLHHQQGSISNRSQSFDCRTNPRNDAFGSPGPRFLHLLTTQEQQDDDDLDADSPFKVPASIPFKWEIAPGQPRPEVAVAKPEPCLQLPPRLLLLRSFTTKQQAFTNSNPDRGRRAHSVNHRQSLLLGMSPSSSSSPKHQQQGSPTSVFCGPSSSRTATNCASSSSSSSSSSECESASRCIVVSDAESGVENGSHSNLLDDSSNLGPQKPSLGDSIARIFTMGKARLSSSSSRKKQQQQQQQSSEMWAPTLAAYFQSSASNPCQELALVDADLVSPKSQGSLSEGSSVSRVESNDLEITNGASAPVRGASFESGDRYCGCASPAFPAASSLKRLGSGRQKKWVITRLRKSSRVLQAIVSKTIKHAVHSRPKSQLDSSKLLYHPVVGDL